MFFKDLSDTTSYEDDFKFEEAFKKKHQSKKCRQQNYQPVSATTNSNSSFQSTNDNSNQSPKNSIGEYMPCESTR